MRNTALAILLVMVVVAISAAQDSKPLPAVSIAELNLARGTPGASAVTIRHSNRTAAAGYPFYPLFCPPHSCLYYAGDTAGIGCDGFSISPTGRYDE
jgi:hypothetical protein